MKITWYGTASILLETEGRSFLFDPFVQLPGGEHPNTPETFRAGDVILITHGHLDHLLSVPQVLSVRNRPVYCTGRAADTLFPLMDGSPSPVVCVVPGEQIRFGGARISVFQGKHITFDRRLIFQTLFRRRVPACLKNALFLAGANRKFPEGGETVVYQVEAEQKSLLLLGSAALDPNTEYPKHPDLCILPYQGNSEIAKLALEIVERLRPGAVLLDHFDDAFPPVSQSVDTNEFKSRMRRAFPGIRVIQSEFGKPFLL